MTKRNKKTKADFIKENENKSYHQNKGFHIEFLNPAQKLAWEAFDKHDVIFLLGSPGTGKSFLSVAFAVGEVLSKRRKKITLTRPIVEAGEKLGFLPGDVLSKVGEYFMPLYDCLDNCVGKEGPQREIINRHMEVAPIAYLRGRTFNNSVCILDEAQNCTFAQIKLFLTRFGEGSKVIITGDPNQSDLPFSEQGLMKVVNKLSGIPEIGIVKFNSSSIVRHPLIAAILDKLESKDNN